MTGTNVTSTALEESRLSIKKEEHEAFLEQVGRDGSKLLTMLYQEETPSLLTHLPQVQLLRQIWVQQFFWEDGQLRLRNKDGLPPLISRCALLLIQKLIVGEKVYFRGMDTKSIGVETCDPDYPHLITCVQTTDATASDMRTDTFGS